MVEPPSQELAGKGGGLPMGGSQVTTLWVERMNGGMERILSNSLPSPGVLGPLRTVGVVFQGQDFSVSVLAVRGWLICCRGGCPGHCRLPQPPWPSPTRGH